MPPSHSQSADQGPIPPKPSGSGPIVGILIIIVVMSLGAFYLWGEHLNRQTTNNPPPYIPEDISTTTLD